MLLPRFACFICFLCCITAHAQRKLIVAQQGKADYTSIQAALDALPCHSKDTTVIYIRKGVYKEKIVVDASRQNISLIGEDASNTIITYNDHAGTRLPNGDTLNTWTCATVLVYGNNFHAEHLQFENNAGFTAGQAVAVRLEGDRASFKHCSFTGFQDVLFLSGNGVKHYFEDCSIEGTTDFIFGAATAVFNRCHIHSKKNSHVTAASTNSIIPFGFVFVDCRLTADSTVNKVSLGRPWAPAANVAYLRCYLGNHIIPEGWNNWRNPCNEATARYAEYRNYGPGADTAKRVSWSRQLTDEAAAAYTLPTILGAWKPYSN